MDILLRYGIWACLVALILTAFGFPVPEEISLLVLGGISHRDPSIIVVAWIIGQFGVVFSDVLVWVWGRRFGYNPSGFVGKMIGKDQLNDISTFYDRWGNWSIIIARMIPGIRVPTFFFAGASGMPIWKFLSIDVLGSLVPVNLYFFLGYSFSDELPAIRAWIQSLQSYGQVLGVALIGSIVYVIYSRKQTREARRRRLLYAQPEPADLPHTTENNEPLSDLKETMKEVDADHF